MPKLLRICALLAFSLLIACSKSDGVTIHVKLVSDLVAGPEAARARTKLMPGTPGPSAVERVRVERNLVVGEVLVRGLEVATLKHVPTGANTIEVALLRPDGSLLASRPLVFDATRDTTITVHLTADCADVQCPNAAGGPALSACLQGTCVDPRCDPSTDEGRSHCPQNLFCNGDQDCESGTSACAAVSCQDALCVSVERENACEAGTVCVREHGCVAPTDPLDDMRALCGRVCEIESAPCRFGYYACTETEGGLQVGCAPIIAKDLGTTCGDSAQCDGNGACVSVDALLDASMMDSAMSIDATPDARVDAPRDAAREAAVNHQCDSNPCGHGTCTTVGSASYRCTCDTGYSAPMSRGTCTDINECESTPTICDLNQHCTNEPGTYACQDVASLALGQSHSCAIFDGGSVKCWGNGYAGLGYGDYTDRLAPTRNAIELGGAATAIEVGWNFSCALLEDGGIKCWGNNSNGQLGYGDHTERTAPAELPISLGAPATAISAGDAHVCAILEDGSVKCWGYNYNGQLGYGDTNNRSAPPEEVLSLSSRAIAIMSASAHSCAILEDGGLYCWGANNAGQLGKGDLIERTAPAGTKVGLDDAAATHVVGSAKHTCAALSTGRVKCWGGNGAGELGVGTVGGYETTPVQAHVPEDTALQTLSAGFGHTCASFDNGTVYCWGANGAGQLGVHHTRTGMYGAVDLDAPASAVFAGNYHSCAILRDGNVRCWGYNFTGELGYGDRTMVESPPLDGVSLGESASSIATYNNHTCAVLLSGAVKCWGLNQTGQLGDFMGSNISVPLMTSVTIGGNASHVATGDNYSCAVRDGHGVQCWGFGAYGELGYGDTNNRETGGADIANSSGATHITTGARHSCAIIGGEVYCWGANYAGELGLGDTLERHEISDAVILLGDAIDVDAGNDHTCAITDTFAIQCWGGNNAGQLGYGDTTPRASPNEADLIVGDRNPTSVSAGGSATCALFDDGTVKCWGGNSGGLLGYGDFIDRHAPPDTPIVLAAPAIAVSVGPNHACAALADGRIQCWGDNFWGQLGYGDRTHRNAPGEPILLDDDVTSIECGLAHTCALLADGRITCWGSNEYGQLGITHGLYWAPPTSNVDLRGTHYLMP